MTTIFVCVIFLRWMWKPNDFPYVNGLLCLDLHWSKNVLIKATSKAKEILKSLPRCVCFEYTSGEKKRAAARSFIHN